MSHRLEKRRQRDKARAHLCCALALQKTSQQAATCLLCPNLHDRMHFGPEVLSFAYAELLKLIQLVDGEVASPVMSHRLVVRAGFAAEAGCCDIQL